MENNNLPTSIVKESKTFWFLFGLPFKPRFEYSSKDGHIVSSNRDGDSHILNTEIKISMDSFEECVDKLMSDPMYQHFMVSAEYKFIACKRTIISLVDDCNLRIYDDNFQMPYLPEEKIINEDQIDEFALNISTFTYYHPRNALIKDNTIKLNSDTEVKSHIEIFELMKSHKEYPELEKLVQEKEYSFFAEQKKAEQKRKENILKTDIQFMKNYVKKYPTEALEFINELNKKTEKLD